jgi:hypothetical protein
MTGLQTSFPLASLLYISAGGAVEDRTCSWYLYRQRTQQNSQLRKRRGDICHTRKAKTRENPNASSSLSLLSGGGFLALADPFSRDHGAALPGDVASSRAYEYIASRVRQEGEQRDNSPVAMRGTSLLLIPKVWGNLSY